ncbi:thioesterase family protein [Luteipulveratus sp. YIM 133132]|uniref:Thioesterase family protein n=1 Tax=Luteipulveratus flavus TaxID=3031728 RepID=A0ABT6C918_9MICO|nr:MULTISPECIES: thioesterase family protein [unclassified Luteipulveratus]MDE9366289.1 thioesterase family protein [Luteipulveratus sp. YIM 133132]MDF8265380.1 thioesterase family protein [Luteipulveratus sp. YIM 133296]
MPSRPYAVDVPLRWSDMDALRHVNNVQFVRLLEESRVLALRDWFRRDDGSVHHPQLLIARTEIDYLRQLKYRPEPVVIALWVSKVSGASFDICYEVRDSRADDAQVYAAAETTQVCFDMEAQRPVRLTDQDRALLRKVEGAPVALRRRPVGHA